MKSYESILTILKQNGYDETTNVSDFYFNNRERLDPLIFGPNYHSDEFANRIKWKSEFGVACVNAIKRYIEEKLYHHETIVNQKFFSQHHLMMNDPEWQKKVKFDPEELYVTIDFSDFSFQYQNRSWTINEFTYSFKTGRIGGQLDLIGIDLSGISLKNCRLVGLCFGNANFDNATMSHVELIATTFQDTSFRHANLGGIHVKNGSYFNSADFTTTGVFGIYPLGDKCLTEPFKYTEISYFYLLKITIKSLLHIKSHSVPGRESGRHTAFANNPTSEMTLPQTRALKEYITWYQFTMDKVVDFPNIPFLKKVGFLFSVIATKHWTSYWALAFFALILNFIYPSLFLLCSHHFEQLSDNYFTLFYDSMLIFTSLGLEGIKPISPIGQILVISETISGYVVLALFVFLLARKVEWKY
jgi:hypothetical protein